MNEIEQLLREQIQADLEGLEGLEIGSQVHQIEETEVATLADRVIEIKKLEVDSQDKAKKQEKESAQTKFEQELKQQQFEFEQNFKKDQLETEQNFKKKQFEFEQELKQQQFELEKSKCDLEKDFKLKQSDEEKKDRLIKNCLSVAGIVLPIWVTIWGTLKTLEFEKEGTVTTIMGRGFINKLLPRK